MVFKYSVLLVVWLSEVWEKKAFFSVLKQKCTSAEKQVPRNVLCVHRTSQFFVCKFTTQASQEPNMSAPISFFHHFLIGQSGESPAGIGGYGRVVCYYWVKKL